ncbi:MAG: zinc ABC transporter solute-binding protein [bacterium]|nr:zinc ABC transporter solute-binding protein [bacterium]
MKNIIKNVLLFGLLIFLTLGCGKKTGGTGEKEIKEKPIVTVSILPQKYFVQRIVGENYRVNVMVPPGHSPATYEPSPREMKAVSQSVLYFRIGHIGFEKAWMDKIASLNKGMKTVDTSEGVSLITGTVPHSHGDEHHHHGGTDPHIWLSPSAVKIQVKHIWTAFTAIETDAVRRVSYEKNYHAFIGDIEALQVETGAMLQPLAGRKFLVYHPAWSYLARDFGLVQFPIETGGKNPGAADLKRIVDTAKQESIRVIFVQQQFDAGNARAVAQEIGGKVIAMDPLAPDWLANMKKIARTFKEALVSE